MGLKAQIQCFLTEAEEFALSQRRPWSFVHNIHPVTAGANTATLLLPLPHSMPGLGRFRDGFLWLDAVEPTRLFGFCQPLPQGASVFVGFIFFTPPLIKQLITG